MGGMQGGLILMAIIASTLAPSVAYAADPTRRQVCAKVEPQRYQTPQQQQQQRARTQECRNTRVVPPVVDPTPFFLL